MASSELSWTESEATVNQLAEYQIFRATKVGSADIGAFLLIGTNEVERDAFGEITNPVTVLEFSDTTVDFGTESYQYRIDGVPVFVGEAPSAQTPPGRSNILALGDPPEPVTGGSGSVVVSTDPDLPAGTDVPQITWEPAVPGINAVVTYRIRRSVDNGPFLVLIELPANIPDITTYVFTDNSIDFRREPLDSTPYAYDVIGIDEIGIEGEPVVIEIRIFIDVFVAVANSGATSKRAMTSPDGLVWTSKAMLNFTWRQMAYAPDPDLGSIGSGRLVAVSENGDTQNTFSYSDDGGETWISASAPVTAAPGWNAIAYSPASTGLGMFAAISDSAGSDGMKVITSVDGIVWVRRLTPATADGEAWTAMLWDSVNAQFVAGGDDIVEGAVMTSPDGIVWTHVTTPAIAINERIAQLSSGRMSSTNRFTTNAVLRSDDGITWLGPSIGQVVPLADIASDGSLFVGCGVPAGGLGFASSPDGAVFTAHAIASPGDGGIWEALTFDSVGALGWCAVNVGNGLDQVALSSDGTTWSVDGVTVPLAGAWQDVIAVKRPEPPPQQEMVLLNNSVSRQGGVSEDGHNWTVQARVGPRAEDVAYSESQARFATVGGSSVAFSDDGGETWTAGTRASACPWVCVAFFAAAGTNPDPEVDESIWIKGCGDTSTQAAGSSPDGDIWTSRTTPNAIFQDVAVDPVNANAILVGVDPSNTPIGNVIHSVDGITWTIPTGAHATDTVIACTYDTTRSRFVAIQDDGNCNVSTTGASGWSLNINGGDIIGNPIDSDARMAYSESLDILIYSNSLGIWSSPDGGVNWTQRDSTSWQGVVWADGLNKFFACDDAAPRMAVSVDGINWSDIADPDGALETWRAIAVGAVL